MKTLLIVESPAKSKTIEKLLGKDYIVKASFGHIRDLDPKEMGIEVENRFRPVYKILSKSSKHIAELKDVVSRVDRVLLASDEDREGEAIAWHCAVVLKIPTNQPNRICFHEITESALRRAVENPRMIDMNMVNSQQARRILDRLVGFEISPLLWKSVGTGLSAGRVQSVCLKLIVEKENEVERFSERRYFKTLGYFSENIIGTLNQVYESYEEVQAFLMKIKDVSIFRVESIESKRNERRPPAPYTTSSIQQDLGVRFRLSSKSVMAVLQHLYESGKITYHRTDSTLLSEHIMKEIKTYVIGNEELGKDYYHPRVFKTKSKAAQEAHEAIRPTSIFTLSLDGEDGFDDIARKVYQMIWRRTVASQMSPFVFDLYTMTIGIDSHSEKFIANAERTVFEGYKKIYEDVKKEDEEEEVVGGLFGDVSVGTVLKNDKIVSTEKYQNPPPRYSEATIIKKMEVAGIGRPSTYANILGTLFDRDYIEKKNVVGQKRDGKSFILKKKTITEQKIEISIGGEKQKLIPTEVGKRTSRFLEEHFPNIMNETFTSSMESRLDEIASGTHAWVDSVGEYYQTFHPTVVELSQTTRTSGGDRPAKRCIGEYEGKKVYVYEARYGPVYQIGEDKDKEKKYVKLGDGKKVDTVEMRDLMETISTPQYPREVGRYQDQPIYLSNGRYGFYLRYRDQNYKIKEGMTAEEITEEEAIQCLGIVSETREDGSTKTIVFPIQKGKYQIKNGQYGPYVQLDKIFASIPKTMEIERMTEEDCKRLIEERKEYDKKKKSEVTKKKPMKKSS